MATLEIPQPDRGRFSPVCPELVVLACVARSKQAMALTRLQDVLRTCLTASLVAEAVAVLVEGGEIAEGPTLRLTPEGETAASKALGRDANETWHNIKAKRLPLLALGLDADNTDLRRKFSRHGALKAATIAVAFGLPKEMIASPKAVCSEIVWRLLRNAVPGVVGKGPFPTIQKPGPVERAVLGGIAGIRAKSITQATDALTAQAVGLEKASAEVLRSQLIAIGVELFGKREPGNAAETRASLKTGLAAGVNGVTGFAANVSKVASQLRTPPFQDRVAIAQVYDAYGKFYADAGSLQSFKERLVNAARSHQIQLGRLDLPERMGKELRDRSETVWDRDEVHFVITE